MQIGKTGGGLGRNLSSIPLYNDIPIGIENSFPSLVRGSSKDDSMLLGHKPSNSPKPLFFDNFL